MRILSLLGIFLLGFSTSFSQESVTKAPYYGQMIYWKSLSSQEKDVFLFAYLSCSYEIVRQMEEEGIKADKLSDFRKNYTRIVERVFSAINENPQAEQRIIQWVDTYYTFQMYQNSPFREALKWAYDKYRLEQEQ